MVLDFYTDVAKGKSLGIGGIFRKNWYFAQWEPGYIERYDPSIEYLELLGICVAYFTWGHLLRNQRIILFCDNQAVVTMINNTTAKCQNCMILIRMLILRSLWNNTRIFCRWVAGRDNTRSDLLSRQKIQQFKDHCQENNIRIKPTPAELPHELWPASKLWAK